MWLPTRRKLDDIFPTLVRYVGLALAVGLGVAAVVGRLDYPSGFVLALGMVLFKTVKGASGGKDSDDDS